MAKKFLVFENKRILIGKLELIETFERWNDKELRMDYTIEINRPYHESALDKMPFRFNYSTPELRDARLETLEIVLADHEVEFITS